MQAENLAREAEIAELRDLLAKARADLAGKMEEDKDQMISRLEKENNELKRRLSDEVSLRKMQVEELEHKLMRVNSLVDKLQTELEQFRRGGLSRGGSI